MNTKKIIAVILSMVFCLVILGGCGSRNGGSATGTSVGAGDTGRNSDRSGGKKYSVVCTVFPEYDWAGQILGERKEEVALTLLLNDGTDLHSYQPTAEDIARIAACDLFIYVGGESDEWVEDALKEAVNKNMQVINLMEVVGDSVKEEEVVEGMQPEEEEEEGEEEPEYDEHVWLSLKNTQAIVQSIGTALAKMDEENQNVYKENTEQYVDKLKALDEKYESVIKAGIEKTGTHTLLFGDRFPFRYLTDDYGLDYYAAFVGCSAETEASFETITFLSGKIDELGLKNIFVIESSDQKIAETIVSNTKDKNQKILVLDSMQSTTSKEVESGVTYLSVMEKNLEVLQQSFGL